MADSKWPFWKKLIFLFFSVSMVTLGAISLGLTFDKIKETTSSAFSDAIPDDAFEVKRSPKELVDSGKGK